MKKRKMGTLELGMKKANLTIAEVKNLVELIQGQGGEITYLNVRFEEMS